MVLHVSTASVSALSADAAPVLDRRVKVLFVPQWYPPPTGQNRVSGTFCREHVHAAALYDDVAVLSFSGDAEKRWGTRVERRDDHGIPTWYAAHGRSPIPRTTRLLFWGHLWRTIRAVCREWGTPDVVHTQDAYAYPVMRCCRHLGVPYVVSQHWTAFLRRSLTPDHLRRFKWALPRAHRVLASSFDAEASYRAYGIEASVRWLPNAFDPAVFRPIPPRLRDPWLLHASGFTPQKRCEDIVRAFARVRADEPTAVLHLAGDGPGRHAVEALARELLPTQAVCFHGFLAKERLAELMRRCGGFVFPSSAETFGCVLMEAMASGCPVLTTRVGGIPAVVGRGEGVFVDVGDLDAIAAGMRRLLLGEHGIDTMAVAQRTKARFSRVAVGRILHEEHLAAAERGRATAS